MGAAATTQPSGQGLRRSLGLADLIFIGIILVQPTAPMPLFGVVSNKAHGHVATAILLAMVAMLFTAISYGRMASVYPSAGSAYTYVGQEIHPALGYATGWSMLMDYVLNPVICTIWCSKAAANTGIGLPYWLWAIFFAALFTLMNLRRVQATARTNQCLTIGMGLVILAVLAAAARYVLHLPRLDAALFTRPLFDPATFSVAAVSSGASVAVLTYIGFDGISTLSEEVRNPRRNILLATVFTCLTIGILSAVEVYAGQLVWPASEPFPDIDTAYVHMAGRAGGMALFHLLNLTLLVATIGSGSGAQLAGARLLYGMGRDNALPKAWFGHIDPGRGIPRNAVLFIGAISLAGAFLLTYELGAQLLNFGALIGFMGVNAAALLRYYVRAGERRLRDLAAPLAGFLICLYMWLNLGPIAKAAGGAWLVLGFIYGAWKTKGFRRELVRFDAVAE